MSSKKQSATEQSEEIATKAFRLTQSSGIFLIVVTAAQMATSALGLNNLETAEFVAIVTATSASTIGFWALNRFQFSGAGRG